MAKSSMKYKVPTILAFTLAGATFTANHAYASEKSENQNSTSNILDKARLLETSQAIKQEVQNPTTHIAGTQIYKDPSIIQTPSVDQAFQTETRQNDLLQPNRSTQSPNTSKPNLEDVQSAPEQVKVTSHTNKLEAATDNLANSEKAQQNDETSLPHDRDNSASLSDDQQVEDQPQEETAHSIEEKPSIQKSLFIDNSHNIVSIKDENKNPQNHVVQNTKDDNDSNYDLSSTIQYIGAEEYDQHNAKINSDNSNSVETPKLESNLKIAEPNKHRTAPPTSQIQPFSGFRVAQNGPKLKLPQYKPKVNSSINTYIRKNNFPVPQYEQDIASYLPQFSYRYGKPEGIVMHDTANDHSTIGGEVSFMKNNYRLAFVHAYVDGNRIIETANTDYGAWGAGSYANQRFIHVELVHTHDYNSFARSINNYADYAATNLLYYGLKPDSAEYDGQGTVWTHRAVSNYLGGTDHVDPHGYLAVNNYSYDELYDLINEKYLIKTNQVAPWGVMSSSSMSSSSSSITTKPPETQTSSPKQGHLSVSNNSGVARINNRNDGLYTTVYDHKGIKTSQTNKTLKVTKSASIGTEKFYLVTDYNDDHLFGWIHQNDVVYNKAGAIKKVKQTYQVKSGETLYLVPWGTSTQKAGTVSGKGNQLFNASQSQLIGSTQYVYGTVNKLSGWIKAANLVTASKAEPVKRTPSASSTKLVVTPLTNARGTVVKNNHGVYTTVYDQAGVQKSYVNGKTYHLTKKATLGKKQFYLLNDQNTNIGWMLIEDVVYKEPTSSNMTQSVSKIGQVKRTNAGIKATVYDKVGKHANVYSDKTFKISKQRKEGTETYVLLMNERQNTPLGWINTKDVTIKSLSQPVSTKAHYTLKSNNHGLYSIPWGTQLQQIDNLKQLKNNIFVASQTVKVDQAHYLFGTINNKTGWILSTDLTPVKTASSNQKESNNKASRITPYKYDFVITNKGGKYYSSPNAKAGNSLLGSYETIFKVLEQQSVNGETWYHGKLSNGKLVWIKASDLRKELVRYYRSHMTLNQAARLQYNLSYKPQVQHIPGKWDDATLQEIKQAMDTTKIEKDPVQKYQFLRLDTAQNLSLASLNKLLKGKGVLEGQGSAFSEAAKLYNINEIYLISHALLETGNGTSTLSRGGDVVKGKVVTTGKKYYNMFGIGAVDHDALRGGFNFAKKAGWNTIQKAIVGGAKFIAGRYIHEGQNTLYKMRWNPANPGQHQYATDIGWAKQNAIRIKSFYDLIGQTGKYFDVNTYQK
ncbi:GW dipeptide domain-containing protein [Staphylococcus sp. SQ8-PEA]|uniref:Bifunctional autolysin n=1 Tax=Staphylococcus marylandisciuri TaxID=2981529 RepID=A0ABT2QPY1_9STAP|nr:GW dipeptide domain-containing protein [Staphylococcus marylandisciuri]MCU5746029.1 GW dipeptide domain-containing protein [Staphylococcus marylandisciuri]